ncbi:MAG: sugar-binding domain-containing protein [Streptosporangiaceae bacterium]
MVCSGIVLIHEPTIRRVFGLWSSAKCAVVGIGAPPLLRQSIPAFVPTDAISMRSAVGDVCSRFLDRAGEPVAFPGLERLVATPLEVLRELPVSIGIAVGQEKIAGIIAAARGGYINHLVTDSPTAVAIVAAVQDAEPPRGPAKKRTRLVRS